MTIFEDFLCAADLTAKKTLLKTYPELLTMKNDSGQTLLHIVARADNIDEVKLLLAVGGNVCSHDNDGRTPMHYAISRNNEALVKLFIESSTDSVNTVDNLKWSPLHLASFYGYEKLGYLLVKAGADVEAKAAKGRTYEKFAKTVEFIQAVQNAQSELLSEKLAMTFAAKEISEAFNKCFFDTSKTFELKVAGALLETVDLVDTDPC